MAETISEIQGYIDQNCSLLLEDWFSLIRHKSISATGKGVEECADNNSLLIDHLETVRYYQETGRSKPVTPLSFPLQPGNWWKSSIA